MKLTPESPELTALALDELDPAQRSEVEAALAADPALRAEVDALRTTAGRLERALADAPAPALTADQREALRAAALRSSAAEPPRRRPVRDDAPAAPWWTAWLRPAIGCALAAVVVAAGIALWPRPSDEQRFSRLRYQPGRTLEEFSPKPATPALDPATDASRSLDITTASVPEQVLPYFSKASGLPSADAAAASPVQADPYSLRPAHTAEPESLTRLDVGLARRYGLEAKEPPAGQRPKTALAPEHRAPVRARPDEVLHILAQQTERVMEERLEKAPGLPALIEELEVGQRTRFREAHSGEGYAPIVENSFRDVSGAPLSTFGLDVDTASYANVRRMLTAGQRPPADAVRLEELVNYFRHGYAPPQGDDAFAIHAEITDCPWNEAHRLLRVGIKARELPRGERPPANLVFLVDVSGSMDAENKLPLVKQSLRLLLDQLTPRDTVGIVTYAGEAGVALPPTPASERGQIAAVLNRLRPGGGTAGSAGLEQAYALATNRFRADGVNRVVLCTDGDFNIGVTGREDLLELITRQAQSGVFLSVLGYGIGNYKDATAELLADRGNGNYAYIDSFREARKALVEQLEGTLVTVARDVKLQLEFNPARVVSWRQLGYENRRLADRDFNDDTKDAGDIGAGHEITALYELVPVAGTVPGAEALRFAGNAGRGPAGERPGEVVFIKLRHQPPGGGKSRLMEVAVPDTGRRWAEASPQTRFAAAVTAYGLLLRDSAHKGALTWDQALRLAEQTLGDDPDGLRAEFVDLVRRASELAK